MKLRLFLPLITFAALAVPVFAGVGLDDSNPIELTSNPRPMASTLGSDWVPMLHKGTRELSLSGKVDWEDFSDIGLTLG